MLLSFALLALAPQARASCQEGCDPNTSNTYLGDDALVDNTTGSENTAVGQAALANNTTGFANAASGYSALISNTSGYQNTADGFSALWGNTTGNSNTAIGWFALGSNQTASSNTATGNAALSENTTGSENTAQGALTLNHNQTGSRNVAAGANALYLNVVGGDNTATGYNALYHNTASYNTATGYQALESNTTGSNNTADGLDVLNTNTTGSNNTAEGFEALFHNTTGDNNTAIGYQALYQNTTANSNTAIGLGTLQNNTTGSGNIALGLSAGFNVTTGSNNIDIGNNGIAGDFARIRIGTKPIHKNTFIAGIFGVTVPTGLPVLIDNSGHLGTTTSSARFKEDIQPMDKASEAILSLKPVIFRYKQELDPAGTPQFGLVAEEVEKVNPKLVGRDDDGKPYSVRYDAVNAMLLNEFLKEHRKGQEQDARINKLYSALAEQRQQIVALTSLVKGQAVQIKKVSAQLAGDKSRALLMAKQSIEREPRKDNLQ
jgi:uncharacterized coiled-coil protein SlyX